MRNQADSHLQEGRCVFVGIGEIIQCRYLALQRKMDKVVNHRQQHLFPVLRAGIFHGQQPGPAQSDIELQRFGVLVLPVDRRSGSFSSIRRATRSFSRRRDSIYKVSEDDVVVLR